MTATTAGFSVAVRGRRVYLVDVDHHRDPGLSHHEARELAQRLLCAAPPTVRGLKCPNCKGRDWHEVDIPVAGKPMMVRGQEVVSRPHHRIERRCANCGHQQEPELKY
jgi:hypothetical protein